MRIWKVAAASSLLVAAGLLILATAGLAEPSLPNHHSNMHQLSDTDARAIQAIIKGQETAWNNHDMRAFTQSFREDAEGINAVGMYWRGKAQLLKHLTEYHKTILKDHQETVEEVSLHPIGEGYAVAVLIWNVGAFKAPNGVEFPACRHRSTLVFAKGAHGWEVVHFQNATIDEAALKGAEAPPAK